MDIRNYFTKRKPNAIPSSEDDGASPSKQRDCSGDVSVPKEPMPDNQHLDSEPSTSAALDPEVSTSANPILNR
ncbi:hypothetical protein DPMN_138407 [Dreissena polymorpha]|uniref:Uncharacterized protein n=1 Tax=Dreissena polymorpha TaxID=45954 RepID=A0A9D4G3S2_DREPO|nr:hypothetical protein DPMN_138407 [Dreissena polymorpha]